MKRLFAASLATLLAAAAAPALLAQAAPPAGVPLGRLGDAARPTAYRLDLTVAPDSERFSGHAEIDVTVARATRTLFVHGNGLAVSQVTATVGGRPITASYSQVDPSGVARLDFAAPLPAGKTTLAFIYTAPFMTGSEGLYRAKVGEDWYAWTQMEPIDARRMFPGFDEPGFKTPFTVAITAKTGLRAFANTPELRAAPAANGMTRHEFAPSKPLPTYLVAVAVGAFDVVEGSVPANAARPQPLPYRVIATKGQAERLKTAAAEGPRILSLHEEYFGSAYPFEKLDQIASPIMGGAMENAGLVTYNDTLLLLGPDAPPSQRRGFGTVVAHELAHQWFGDLVTPVWWNDIWLNESFAEWAGNRVGEIWQPGLGTDTLQLAGALGAMDTDSRAAGRPIRQAIARNTEVASAFDSITYEKGGQVLTMVERYLGPDRFRRGVQTHLGRFRYGSATAEDFFASMAQGSGDPAIVTVFQSFVSQTGVPVIAIRPAAGGWALAQARYKPLGATAGAAQTWSVPVCARQGEQRSCTLLTGATGTLRLGGTGTAVPNADGAGYYRYSMDDAGWATLMGAADRLPAREAMVAADSLWSDFAAGNASFSRVLASARALARHPDRVAATQMVTPITTLPDRLLSERATAGYRRLMQELYGARLAGMGLDLKRGAYAQEDSGRRQLRQTLVGYVAIEARDAALRGKLSDAAEASVAGNADALDPAYRPVALRVAVTERGVPFMNKLYAALIASGDPLFRQQAVQALGAADTPALVARAMALTQGDQLQSIEKLRLTLGLAGEPVGRDAVFAMLAGNFDAVIAGVPAFVRPRLPSLFASYCDAAKADQVDALFKSKAAALGGGELETAQAVETIRLCVALKQAKGAEIEAAFSR